MRKKVPRKQKLHECLPKEVICPPLSAEEEEGKQAQARQAEPQEAEEIRK
jgi:hypothetical protein